VKMIAALAAPLFLLSIAPAAAQAPGPFEAASADDLTAQVEKLGRDMKPGQGFAYKPLLRGGDAVAAIEYWKAPGRPAIHPTQAEYAIVLEGAGTLLAGGTMTDQEVTNPTLIQGARIDGGTTRKLVKGDVIMIPAGVPHSFGIDGRLVLLGTKIAVAPAP
jgi:mannose-6-phosphate isomerase-like protein (cupin superfamily)